MNYLPAINVDLQDQGINSRLVEAVQYTNPPEDMSHVEVMIGEGIMMRIEQDDDIITMTKYKIRKPQKPINEELVAGHPKFEWQKYWDRSYELADPENFSHAMDLISRWASEGKNAADPGRD